jgi:rubrerythrin
MANPIREIIEAAIQREIEAYDLYTRAAGMVEEAHFVELLRELAAQELGHRRKLEALLAGDVFTAISGSQRKQVADLKITDYLVEVPLNARSDFQDILIVAGKRERASHELYTSLAQIAETPEAVALFEFLAAEEAAHKNRVESLYEKYVYREN